MALYSSILKMFSVSKWCQMSQQHTNIYREQLHESVRKISNKSHCHESRPTFAFTVTHLHTCSITFTTDSIQRGWITAKSSQTWFPDSPHLMTRSQNTTQQRKSTLWTLACYFIIFSSLWFNLFFLAFFLECLLPACENGVYIDELGPDIDFPSLPVWTFSGLLYYTCSIFPQQL